MIEFIKWAFKDPSSTIITLLVLGIILTFITNLVQIIFQQRKCNCPKHEASKELDKMLKKSQNETRN